MLDCKLQQNCRFWLTFVKWYSWSIIATLQIWLELLSKIHMVDVYTLFQSNSIPFWDVSFSSSSSFRNVNTQSNLSLQIINTKAQLIGFILQKYNNKAFVFPYNYCKIILITIRAELIKFTYHNNSSHVSGHLQEIE